MGEHVPVHGGDLAHAQSLVRDAIDPDASWIDLSTGINPIAYDIGPVPEGIWNRLPDADSTADLLAVARGYYAVQQGCEIVAAAGSQALLSLLPNIFKVKSVQIVGPTYGGHQTGWRARGCDVKMIGSVTEADPACIVVVVHPNNPNGVLVARSDVLALVDRMKSAGGLLIVDEAFCDCVPDCSLVPHMTGLPILVLKSVGKFFGLAGMRLGFAIGAPELISQIKTALGDWPVSGPALYGGTRALGDGNWQRHTRAELQHKREQLDAALGVTGGEIIGRASLFALFETPHAASLFAHLLRYHIYVRAFDYNPHWLRIGLPKTDEDGVRLALALASFEGR